MKPNQDALKRDLKINPEQASGKFVIFYEAEEAFLGSVEDESDVNILGWTPNPFEAITYESPDHAVSEAKRIARNLGHTLEVCELHHTSQGLGLAPVLIIEPNNDRPKPPTFH